MHALARQREMDLPGLSEAKAWPKRSHSRCQPSFLCPSSLKQPANINKWSVSWASGLLFKPLFLPMSQSSLIMSVWKSDIKADDEHSLHVHHHSFREIKSPDQPRGGVPVPLSDEKVIVLELVAHLSSQEENTKAFHYFYCLIRDSGKKQLCVL